MRKNFYVIIFLFLFFKWSHLMSFADTNVLPGIDVFLKKYVSEYKGKKIALITNPTGMTSDLKSTIDALYELKDPKLIKLFGPEHGLRGNYTAGEHVDDNKDNKTGVPIYSLYGKNRKPSKEMLKDVDVIFYDIQDIGIRPYTYIYTMAYAMEAAAENNIEFVVLDRPIPMNGNLVDGNILEPEFSSFIGLYPIPYVYGMTVGELARFFNEEFKINCKLRVIKMEGYSHNMEYKDTGLLWIPPSPHIPRWETSYYCATTGGIGELGTLSEGVGYTLPFELIGSDSIDGDKLAAELNSRNLEGVFFRPLSFKPYYGRFKGKSCSGVQIIITDTKKFLPYTVQINIIDAIQKLYPEKNFFKIDKTGSKDMFEKAMGTAKIRKYLKDKVPLNKFIEEYKKDLKKFKEKRKKYLLYD